MQRLLCPAQRTKPPRYWFPGLPAAQVAIDSERAIGSTVMGRMRKFTVAEGGEIDTILQIPPPLVAGDIADRNADLCCGRRDDFEPVGASGVLG